MGTVCLLVGSASPLLGMMNPLDAWRLGIVEGLIRVAFLLLGVGALLLGVAVLLDRWPLVGVPSLLFGIAALRVVSRPCWTMDLGGVALLLGPVTALLLGVAFLLDRSALTPIPAVRSRGPRRDWVHGVAADRRTCLRTRRPSRRVREDRRFGQLAVSGQR
jgi:hypothetical protein